MSLDVYLTVPNTDRVVTPAKILVRENGSIREITREEWDKRMPGMEPVAYTPQDAGPTLEVFAANITHNLGTMADAAGIYMHLWRPDEIGITKASQLIEPLRAGLKRMEDDPDRFVALNPKNGWGSYKGFLPWIRNYIVACEANPNADVNVSR